MKLGKQIAHSFGCYLAFSDALESALSITLSESFGPALIAIVQPLLKRHKLALRYCTFYENGRFETAHLRKWHRLSNEDRAR